MTTPGRIQLVTLTFLAGILAGTARSEDFRVENKVYLGNEKEPCVESTTIFHNGIVYDYLKKPAETVVIDNDRGRIVLLSIERGVKTELTTEEVKGFTERFRQRAASRDNPFVAFLASPQFEQQFDDSSRELTFSSQWITYRVKTAAARSTEAAEQYRRFADWQSRLNTLVNPHATPPFARLVVNAELEQRGEIPREVQLTLAPPGRFPRRPIIVRSEHQFIHRLVESDRAQVAKTGQFLTGLKAVSFDQYQKLNTEE